jgi:hypothetical protein
MLQPWQLQMTRSSPANNDIGTSPELRHIWAAAPLSDAENLLFQWDSVHNGTVTVWVDARTFYAASCLRLHSDNISIFTKMNILQFASNEL